jgi:glycosyltransferase involved in cell wall biosynthesis
VARSPPAIRPLLDTLAAMTVEGARIRAYVDLPSGLDADAWRARHERGEVPDASPYGYHRLARYGIDVTFRRPHAGARVERIARSARHRSGGAELLEAVRDLPTSRRSHADVVLGYDERTSVPAALLHAGRVRPPVVAGVGWLTERAATHPVLARLAQAALPRAALVWAQCEPMLPLLTSEWGVPESRVRYLPFGIDTDFYTEQPSAEIPDVVASAGEDRFRDHGLLVRAVRDLQRTRPGVRLELATGLPVDVPPDLGVVHTGRLDGRMRDVYQRSSVVAVVLRPSITGSGLSVVLEAMASGRPVVVTANAGIDRYVRDGVTGVLVPPGDRDALGAAIDGLLADPDRARALGSAAAREVRQRFTSEIMAEELAAIVHLL